MSRVYNFSAGPAVLPESVLQEAADEIRNRLKDLGITLEDRPGGVCVWSKETK